MEQKREVNAAKGQPGDSKHQDPNHIGWMDLVAHPDSPAGGGGPGGFSQSRSKESKGISLPVGKVNDPTYIVPMNTDKPKPPNAPPATVPKSLGTLKKEDSDFWDIAIEGKLVADGSSTGGVETSFTKPGHTFPAYDTDGKGKITVFKGKFKWRGTVEIQTVYGAGATADGLSCYGRGTTANDVLNRDITLGFHEHQHQLDNISYLSNHSLPEPPALSLNMTVTDFNKEKAKFEKAIKKYWKDMEDDSVAKTDEVGHKKSTWESKKTCYEHLLPEE